MYLSDGSGVLFNNPNTEVGLQGWLNPATLGDYGSKAILKTHENKWDKKSGWMVSKVACEKGSGSNYGWNEVDGIELLVGFHPLPLLEAATFCNLNGGRLYEPRDQAQFTTVVNVAQNVGINMFWLGVTDMEIEGRCGL